MKEVLIDETKALGVFDLYKSLMDKVEKDQIEKCRLGIRDSHILLQCDTKAEIRNAMKICESLARDKNVLWTAMPPNDNDIMPSHGYVGWRINDNTEFRTKHNAQSVMECMGITS